MNMEEQKQNSPVSGILGKPLTFGKKGKVLHAQAREVISRLIIFMKEEADVFQRTKQTVIPITNFKQRVIAATGISENLYRQIVKETKEVKLSDGTISFTTPRIRVKEKRKCKNQNKEKPAIKSYIQNEMFIEDEDKLQPIKMEYEFVSVPGTDRNEGENEEADQEEFCVKKELKTENL